MAGIGFELRKVASLGNARGIFQASLSGIMIVAGPWLITILTILVFQQPVMGIPVEFRELFTASTVYIYSSSLVLNGGFHYIFTRILSDYLYRNENPKAFDFTIKYIMTSNLALIPLALLLMKLLFPTGMALHKAAFVVLFVVINHIWVLMLTASAMRRFNSLLLCYVFGMASSLLFMKISVMMEIQDGLLAAYALGQIVLFTMILFTLRNDMGWEKAEHKGQFLIYTRRYSFLFLTGFFYYAALWADKYVYWFQRGERIGGTLMRLYPDYDVNVYITNLMMIPGLVFFVIYSETEFFIVLKKFLNSLGRKPLFEIQSQRYMLISTSKEILKEQFALQAVTTLVFFGIALNNPGLREQMAIIIPTALSIFVLGIFVCLINFMFYVEQYLFVLVCTIIFFAVNIILALMTPFLPFMQPGMSALAGALAGTAAATFCFTYSIYNLDRIIYSAITKNRLREIREDHIHKQLKS